MYKFNFDKEELKTLADKVYLTDIQKRIIEYRMLDYSIVKMANAFINDEDAKKDKVWTYFNTIPKED